jgi:hypothetical protein
VNFRGQRFWGKPDGYSVSLRDDRGVWRDYVTGDSGGMLDLVVKVRGGSRADALRWVADLAGIAMDDTPLSAADRARWAAERRELERIRREAFYFADAARHMAEWALEELSPTDPERTAHTALLAALRVSPEAEYRDWLARDPQWARALAKAGRARQRRLQVALAEFIVGELCSAA